MEQQDYNAVAAILRETMATIRSDVELGLGAEIEADGPVLIIGEGLARYFSQIDPSFDRAAFERAADLLNPIPSEAFQR
jgi:hypothetical protein